MGGLKFFNKDTYESLGDAFRAIKQELLSLCPKDSSSVRWQRGADGMSAVVKTGQSAADDGGAVPEESTSQPSGYNGYFTLKDVSTYNEDGSVKEYRVAVCDGQTWDAETETSGKSTVRLNFASYYLDCTIVSPAQKYIYVQYNDSTQEINITSTDELLESNVEKGVYYYLIGEFDKITARIIQRHTGIGNGEAQIWVATYSCL